MSQPNSEFNLSEFVIHHIQNSNEWHLPFLPAIKLPAFLTLHGLMLIICAALLVVLFGVLYKKSYRAPHGLTNALEAVVVFIRDEICVACLGKEDGIKMTPLFCTFFFFILGLNLMGLIPVFSTATANVNVTAALALITLGFMTFGAIYKNGVKGFIGAFVPHGIPAPVLVLLIPLEFLGMFIKTFALTIRLFANMLAGHIAIFCLLGLIALLGAAALPTIILAIFIYLLEIFVAFLQAYIFTLLSAMFIGQMYHPAH